MKITSEQLNAVSALLNTSDKNVVISHCIKTLVEAGVDARVAFDAVLGTGAFNDVAGQLHDGLTS